ncbi:NUDIX hydrolase [Flavobacterium rhizosphaerae]|uniref:NUDIX domain-containing protein n=1 Tax=Flavobacterium rhizosphaerae TaxID=3163298 RepID=A0ABW8YSR3_9FLAO
MDIKNLLIASSDEAWEKYLPHISIDCVVFGFHDASLKVLLTRLKGENDWLLPGGYVGKGEELKEAAIRILEQRTGAKDIYLQQFEVFDGLNRTSAFFEEYPEGLWHKIRFIAVGFYALVDFTHVIPVADAFSSDCEWQDVNNLPGMLMDHRAILDKALITLRRELNYKPIGLSLLPEEFTMPELQSLYEIILGRKLNRGNFYRKMIAYGILIKLNHSRTGGAHKAPNLYKFDVEKYNEALKGGFKESW